MRRCAEQFKILRDLDVAVIDVRSSGKHMVLRCQSARGDIFSTSISKTPSDHRSLLNWRSDVRRVIERGVVQ